MNFTSITTGRDGARHLTLMDEGRFLDRIKSDTKQELVGGLRGRLTRGFSPGGYNRRHEVPRIFPSIEMVRQKNNALVMRRYNGIVVLSVRPLATQQDIAYVKRAVMTYPSTLAAFVGCSGESVKILVRVEPADNPLPQDEESAERFHFAASRRVEELYNAAIAPIHVEQVFRQLRDGFLLPLDPEPAVNLNAVPLRVDTATLPMQEEPVNDGNPISEEHRQEDEDYDAYKVYERAYAIAARKANIEVAGQNYPPKPDYLTLLAKNLCLAGVPQEEAFVHIHNHHHYNKGYDEELVRSITEAVYAEEGSARRPISGAVGAPMREFICRLTQRYVFRYNFVMGYTEYRRNTTYYSPWSPVTDRVVSALTMEMRTNDFDVWDKDIRRFVNSTFIRYYNPIEEYLMSLPKWDGKDHIRQLARTVPTENEEQWANWFHTWFLAMVAQWRGLNPRFGNSMVPLLVSAQGWHKSTFCRQLLPPELRRWGYTDNLSLSEERSVHLAMSQMLLINLDEFNRISPHKQEGFLKNIVQLPSVKVKRPYARHTEEVGRLASFIATTNQSDVLCDPSGSRRFIGVKVTAPIDISQQPNYEQLYAQAMAELRKKEPTWLDANETAELEMHNLQFQMRSDAMSYFWEYFELASENDKQGEWLSAAAVVQYIKSQAGSVFRVPSTIRFGRELVNIPGIVHKRSNKGEVYMLKKR